MPIPSQCPGLSFEPAQFFDSVLNPFLIKNLSFCPIAKGGSDQVNKQHSYDDKRGCALSCYCFGRVERYFNSLALAFNSQLFADQNSLELANVNFFRLCFVTNIFSLTAISTFRL